MPTVVIKSIKPDGSGDFTGIAAFFAAVPSDLVALDEQWIGECYGTGETLTTSINTPVVTSDATRNIILRAAPGYKAYPDGSGYFLTQNSTYRTCINGSNSTTYITVENIGAKAGTTGLSIGFGSNTSTNFRTVFKNCVAKDFKSGTSIYACGFSIKRAKAINCIAINCTYGFRQNSTWYGMDLRGCGAYDCTHLAYQYKSGSNGYNQGSTFVNDLAMSNGLSTGIIEDIGTYNSNGSYSCASEFGQNAPFPVNTPLAVNLVISDFVDYANSDYHPSATSQFKTAGHDDSAENPFDFDGNPRSTTPAIGPFEAAAAPSSSSSIYLASTNITKAYVGTTQLSKIMFNNSQLL